MVKYDPNEQMLALTKEVLVIEETIAAEDVQGDALNAGRMVQAYLVGRIGQILDGK